MGVMQGWWKVDVRTSKGFLQVALADQWRKLNPIPGLAYVVIRI